MFYSRLTFSAFLTSVLVGPSMFGSATPVEWEVSDGGNGHLYEIISTGSGISYEDARAAAAAMSITCGGQTIDGHLATAETTAEDDFMKSLSGFPQSGLGPWIGGEQEADAAAPDADWTWIGSGSALPEKGDTGDGWFSATVGTFEEPQDWPVSSGETNNENCLLYYKRNSGDSWGWGDAPCAPWDNTDLYMVEYDVVLGCTDPAAVNNDPSACQDDGSCDVKCYDDNDWPKYDEGCALKGKRVCLEGMPNECVKCISGGDQPGEGCPGKNPYCVSSSWGHVANGDAGSKCARCRNTVNSDSSTSPDKGCSEETPRCSKNGNSIAFKKYGNKCVLPLCKGECEAYLGGASAGDSVTCMHNTAGDYTCWSPPGSPHPNGCYAGTTRCIPV